MLKKKVTLFRLLVLSSVLGLSACNSISGCSEGSTHCFGSSNNLLKKSIESPDLNSEFNYIRLNMNGHVVWLAQGATDQWPVPNTKVYYSADRSVFKWANGRLIAVITHDYSWRERTLYPLNWSSQLPLQFTREIDTVEGIIAVKEQRELAMSSIPQHEDFVGNKDNLLWMHEYTLSNQVTLKLEPAFDNWYAFESNNMKEPVYGQHCISNKYCLSWQVWKTS